MENQNILLLEPCEYWQLYFNQHILDRKLFEAQTVLVFNIPNSGDIKGAGTKDTLSVWLITGERMNDQNWC